MLKYIETYRRRSTCYLVVINNRDYHHVTSKFRVRVVSGHIQASASEIVGILNEQSPFGLNTSKVYKAIQDVYY